MSSDVVISAKGLCKCYAIYATPRDRLKQMVLPRLHKALAAVGASKGRGSEVPRYFREFWALREVSLEIRRGETVAIVGRNGSGKSTLLQLICGTLAPTSGHVDVAGRVSALLELGSGFNPEYTGRENVFLNGQILGLTREEIENRYDAIVGFADIGDFIDQPVKTYSSGMAVRLAFAVAINVDPEILIVDEALAVGDVGFQAKCFAKIAELKEKGVTLLFVSHSTAAITQLCDRAVLLDRGEQLLLGTPYQVLRAYNLLANAGRSTFEGIRKEIIGISSAEDEALKNYHDMPPSERGGDDTSKKTNTEAESKEFRPFLDSRLLNAVKATSFDPKGGEISSFHLEDEQAGPVNVLPMHSRAALVFRVRFDVSLVDVRFAWVLKNMHGMVLGGGATHQPGGGISVDAGQELEIRSYFVNVFAPGEYLIDIGVRGFLEREDEFIHGVTNGICLRSESYNMDYRNGAVDCLVAPYFDVRISSGDSLEASPSSESILSIGRQ